MKSAESNYEKKDRRIISCICSGSGRSWNLDPCRIFSEYYAASAVELLLSLHRHPFADRYVCHVSSHQFNQFATVHMKAFHLFVVR